MKKILSILLVISFTFSHSSFHSYNSISKLSLRITPGDINDDGIINIQDIILLVNIILS